MHAEIIAVGTELTSGAKLDTNSQWLSLQLADLGISTLYHTTVADDLGINVEVLRTASQRVDLIIITGGLGPTLDDLTREALAQLANVELVLHQPSLDQIADFFKGRGYEMPARNRSQAMFPAGSQPLANPIGTAPGVWLALPRSGQSPCLLAALPGVPSEMKKMFLEQVCPKLGSGQALIRRARINTFGLGESAVEELLGDLTARGHDPDIGITAHEATITLRITATGNSVEDCQTKIDTASQQIRDRLGEHVFGVEDEELEEVVLRLLAERGRTLITVEGGTCGLLAYKLSAAGPNPAYLGGRVYSSGVNIAAMKEQLVETADYRLLIGDEITSRDERGNPVSTIPILLDWAGDHPATEASVKWTGNPTITKPRAVKVALNLLRRALLRG